MRAPWLALPFTMAAAVVATLACGRLAPSPPSVHSPPQRIVSMAPSLTETLFALGLGDAVVGVTPFCDFPPEAASRAQVGAYLDPGYEAIVALEPDLVVLMQDQVDVEARLVELGLRTVRVDQARLEGILDSFRAIAEACGAVPRGQELALSVQRQIEAVAQRSADLAPVNTLVVIDHDLGSGTIGSVWAAGRQTFYQELLELAGGRNVCPDGITIYPELSREGLLHLDPEVILDIVPDLDARGLTRTSLHASWLGLDELRAVRHGRVHLLDHGYMVIPGPRIALAVEAMCRAIHPDIPR